MTRFCPAMFEDLPDGRFAGDIHEADGGRMVTVPVVGGGAVRILLCNEHADEVVRRHQSCGCPPGLTGTHYITCHLSGYVCPCGAGDDCLGHCDAVVHDMPDGSSRTCSGPVPCGRHPEANRV